MKPDEYQQVKQVFNAALELSLDKRPVFLDEACEGDDSLRNAVEKLLAAHSRADSFIETPARGLASELFISDQASLIEGQRIGPYEITRELGQGGMGAVYLAERADDEYHKQVAIKLVRRGLDTAHILRRFIAERQILANLDHPNIARLIDGGTTTDGLPYIVMEYVQGLPLIEYCDGRKLSTIERLKLFRTVCAAVQYAHQNLVIHRDIKPINILVTADGTAKLLDFGIAKVFHPDPQGQEAEMTRTEFRAMTPEYASPEQVRGERVTTSSDVYSLGVVLYQLLTGLRPYRLNTTDPLEVLRAVCQREPSKPSDAVMGRAGEAEKKSSSNASAPQLRGDLDNIVLMAMRKEPERRYSSVEQFSDDIRRHIEGLPVVARKDTFSYRAGKLIRRNKAVAAAAVLIVTTLIAGIIATAWQARRASAQARLAEDQSRVASSERDRSRLEQTKAERINAFLQQMLAYANPSWYAPGKGKPRDLTVLEALDEASRRINTELSDQPEIRAEIHTTIGDTYRAIGRLDLAEPHFEEALRLRQEIFGDHHVKVAESLYYLGGVKVLGGDHVTGERLYEQALAIQRAMPNEGNNLPYMLLDLSDRFSGRGDYAAAEPMLREAFEIFRGKHGPEHVTVAIVHEYLGTLYSGWGDLQMAHREFEEALRIYEKTPGSMTTASKHKLGSIHLISGEYDKAEPLFRDAHAVYLQLYGENNVLTLQMKYALARLSLERGDYKSAKRETAEAIRLFRQMPVRHDANLANGLALMGDIEKRSGRRASAESYLREAFKLHSRAYSGNDYALNVIKGDLGAFLTEQKRYREAEPLLIESYETLKPRQVARSYRLEQARRRLATLYERWNRPDLAARYRAD
jgi:serine/threonine-protein kinase